MSIADNVVQVREELERACQRSKRSSDAVKLIAVCKFVDTDRIQEALACGIHHVGENRAQELTQKLNFYKQHECDTHFIGQLQSNKIKYICGIADCIQSVDRLALAEALERYAVAHNLKQDILVQVNIGDEPQKGGVKVDELEELLCRLEKMPALCVKGLMCVPPAVEGELVRVYFARMKELFDTMQHKHPDLPLCELSMGMSHDYDIAIEEGATMVRVGTAIFGSRKI